ncbi:hypothetical protein BCR35DRAFT_327205 [Leucosporidium creatinivorum]|uniref:Transcription initiation factor TFIID subunit 8 n=1 Tax=Leucosporidium creatinivorum TaxID=106004 RepID=A0A1Y2D0B3_9BASI|nr:hypothetical protein BCR35DRAFT_327205 [Leucosporidium creatinivorum]
MNYKALENTTTKSRIAPLAAKSKNPRSPALSLPPHLSTMFSPTASASGSRSPTPNSSRTPSPPPLPFSLENPRPDLPPAVAASALRKLVSYELEQAGFEAVTEEALEELEGVVFSFFGSLLVRSHDLANLGRRNQPNFKDLVQGVRDFGVAGVGELKEEVERTKGRDVPDLAIVYDKLREEAPGPTLASDDEPSSEEEPSEDEAEPAPAPPPTIDGVPVPAPTPVVKKKVKQPKLKPLDALKADHLPPLPAKHSYKQTPVYPQSRIPPSIPQASTFPTQQTPSTVAMRHLSTLRSRLNDSQLVASSLRNLIRKTSARATAGGEGAIVGLEGAQQGGQEDDDVVDYEGEWYGGRGGPIGAGVKRSVLMMRVGEEGKVDLEGWERGEEGERDGMGFMKSKDHEWSDAGRVGGAGKRRKWRV